MRNDLNKQSKEIERLQARHQQRQIDEDISEKYDLAKIALQEAQVSQSVVQWMATCLSVFSLQWRNFNNVSVSRQSPVLPFKCSGRNKTLL